MVFSLDVNERKGGILVIVSFIGVEGGNVIWIGRFVNYFWNFFFFNDLVVMEMVFKVIGCFVMVGDIFIVEYVEFEVKWVLEWLGVDCNEGWRYVVVLVFCELVISVFIFFF